MKKDNLKLFKGDIGDNRIKICNKKDENIISIGALVECKDGAIRVLYNQIDVKKCGFNKIKKIEIFKDSKLICYEDRISNFCAEFPYFSSSGVYEVRGTLFNSKDKSKKIIVNTFEFFLHEKKLNSEGFKINLTRVNKDLCVNFKNKVGNIDLSHINLSDVSLLNSNSELVTNIVCKMSSNLKYINFFILDAFDESLSKLLPNETYIFKIRIKDKYIFSSFSFEYVNTKIKCYKIIDDLKYEVLSNISDETTIIKLYIKFNLHFDIRNYEYLISNIRNKFLYFKSSDGENEDTLVFECILRNEKNYFELNIYSGDSVNIIRFDYDFTLNNSVIVQRSYFDMPKIIKNITSYSLKFKYKGLQDISNKVPILGISDRFGQLREKIVSADFKELGKIILDEDEHNSVLFENLNVLNKFSEVYTVELDYDIKENFIFSPSIDVRFNKLEYNSKIICDDSLKLEFLNLNYKLTGRYFLGNLDSEKSNILNNSCEIKIDNFEEIEILRLKFYDEFDRPYFETIVLNYVEIEAFSRISHSEKFVFDFSNSLIIFDKSVFDRFYKDFDVYLMDENWNLLNNFRVCDFNENFKICFNEFNMNFKGFYYVMFQKGDFYKICSFFVKELNSPVNLFIDLNNDSLNINFLKYNNICDINRFLKVSIFLIIDNEKYLFVQRRFFASKNNVVLNFTRDILISNVEYLVCFELDNNRRKAINFTYIGDDFWEFEDFDNVYERFSLDMEEDILNEDSFNYGFEEIYSIDEYENIESLL